MRSTIRPSGHRRYRRWRVALTGRILECLPPARSYLRRHSGRGNPVRARLLQASERLGGEAHREGVSKVLFQEPFGVHSGLHSESHPKGCQGSVLSGGQLWFLKNCGKNDLRQTCRGAALGCRQRAEVKLSSALRTKRGKVAEALVFWDP